MTNEILFLPKSSKTDQLLFTAAYLIEGPDFATLLMLKKSVYI
jgi:hypothetical protein